jgi:hypothetical protein|mmetsp:Transcript_22683/g.54336  ORF Transcript_22683/g.54336 Transcript_22683/m.54336 type:complete len:178 (+) Transcript_22683:40-573(+)
MYFQDKSGSSVENWKKYNKTFMLPRNKILDFVVNYSSTKNLGGYFCRIAIGKTNNNKNLYSIGKIIKPTMPNKINTFPNQRNRRNVILNIKNTNKTFNVNVISNNFPTNDEILKFCNARERKSIFQIKNIKTNAEYTKTTKKTFTLLSIRFEKRDLSYLQKILTKKNFFFKSVLLES